MASAYSRALLLARVLGARSATRALLPPHAGRGNLLRLQPARPFPYSTCVGGSRLDFRSLSRPNR